MRTRLRLFLDWGITFGEAYQIPDRGQRKVYYANRRELENAIRKKYHVSALPRLVSQGFGQHLRRLAVGCEAAKDCAG